MSNRFTKAFDIIIKILFHAVMWGVFLGLVIRFAKVVMG